MGFINHDLLVGGWTIFCCFHSVGNVIIPTDFHIFPRGGSPTKHVWCYPTCSDIFWCGFVLNDLDSSPTCWWKRGVAQMLRAYGGLMYAAALENLITTEKHQRPKPIDDGFYVRGIIPFYGPTIQISELLWFTQNSRGCTRLVLLYICGVHNICRILQVISSNHTCW